MGPLMFSEYDLAASKTSDHIVVIAQNNCANPHTLIVENPSEKPELMVNADSDAPKRLMNVFDLKLLPKTTQCEKREKKLSSSILTSTLIKEMFEQRGKQKDDQEV
ncbi:hypothetical protein TNCV_355181 [Trichonephila clavipes]|uniref:Uncharacterized protein n=1 Tax=Trichonephila clavipes TaxID=2585209 RepID=A0A8X6W193_TRICX|nr:hypothetical protein TNCV_355181 [Trichonephila clavipes]